MQKHNIDITKWIELAAAVSTKSYQRQRNFRRAISASSAGCAAEDVSQENIHEFSPPRANFAAAAASLVLQAQPVLFNLEKFFVKWEDLCWASSAGCGKPAFGVSQNLVQMSGHCHRELRSEVNVSWKSKIENRT
jgi:hypothetical protein